MDGRADLIHFPPWKETAVAIRTGLFVSIALPIAIAFAGGCQHKADGVPMSSNVTELSATPTAPAANYAPAPAQPVYDTAPTPAASSTYASAATGTIAGGSYTIKKGDTLFGIARARYGDGKQWQKIASANPGLSPQSLKVGQTITIP